ncbi:helix-turn-helix domain-containing protein [Halococcus sediminicola]|uniref:helix-turn-helix domain-containing protein n=1 Tax=Halococcus sediminicola TaxID=1264579 RepID=UPI0006796A01|nr:helix-turn-helix domain-containing protein [Halococcus sediminicola]
MSDGTQSVGPPTPRPTASAGATSARFAVPAETFALGPLFERAPSARVTLEPAVTNPDDHALLVVHADEHERVAVEGALRADPAVAAVESFGTHDDGWRYRVTWDGRTLQVIRRLLAAGVSILAADGRSGRWKLRLLAPDRDAMSRAHEALEQLDCNPDCRSIISFDGEQSDRAAMTDEQRETLVTAFGMGYYGIPREVTSAELSDHLGISHQALSERFRRAHKQLVESELVFD